MGEVRACQDCGSKLVVSAEVETTASSASGLCNSCAHDKVIELEADFKRLYVELCEAKSAARQLATYIPPEVKIAPELVKWLRANPSTTKIWEPPKKKTS